MNYYKNELLNAFGGCLGMHELIDLCGLYET